jgi:conjugal transfer pilus assembly protein TraB
MTDSLDTNPNDQIKKKQFRLIMGVLVAVFLGIAAFLFMGDDAPKQDATIETGNAVDITSPGGSSAQDEWRMTAAQDAEQTKQQVNELKTLVDAQTAQNQQLQNQLNETNQRLSEVATSKSSRVETQPTNTSPPSIGASGSANFPNKQGLHGNTILSDPNGTSVDPATGQIIPLPNQNNNEPYKSFNVIDFSKTEDGQDAINAGSNSTPTLPKGSTTFIPDGSFVRVVMINGVDAPTGGQAQSDPIPVVFQTIGKIDMPNSYKMNIKGCRFVGMAWGELSSERVKARIESGNCIINGQTVEIGIKGQIVGEDGKTGIRGRVVSKQGQILAKAALASAMEAVGGLYGQTVGTSSQSALGTVRTITGGELKQAALGGAISGGAEKLSDFYMQRANDIFPIVEVGAGRTLEIMVQKGATVENKFLISSKAINSGVKKRILMDD